MNVFPKMKAVGLLVLISTFICTQVALAQESASRDDEPPKGYIAITFGPTLTTGDFGDNNWDNDSASFATNGYNAIDTLCPPGLTVKETAPCFLIFDS